MTPIGTLLRFALLLFFTALLAACIPPSRQHPVGAQPPTQDQHNNKSSAAPLPQTTGALEHLEPQTNEIIIAPAGLLGRVVGVHDGDSFTLLDSTNRQYKVRLAGIDAPELGQGFGRRAKENLSNLIFNREVAVQYTKVDRYGRLLGKIVVEGSDVNLQQVMTGLAWHYKAYEKEQRPEDRQIYAAAEEAARSARRGLWQERNPVPPWLYRKSRRK